MYPRHISLGLSVFNGAKHKKYKLHRAAIKHTSNTYLSFNTGRDTKVKYLREKQQWQKKALHDKNYNIVRNPQIDKELTYARLTQEHLVPETIQDNVVPTRNIRKYDP